MQCWSCSSVLSKLLLQGLHKHEIAGTRVDIVQLNKRLNAIFSASTTRKFLIYKKHHL